MGSEYLSIKPIKLPGKIINIPIKDLKSGIRKIEEIDNSVVAYIDVLGFSKKQDNKDIEMTQADFSGPLVLAAGHFSKININVFSDCAFLSCAEEHAADLLSAIRFSFSRWISDGLLVRGGIAKGEYNLISTVAQEMASDNFSCLLFSGSAVFEAVKLEGSGNGALLFTNIECANFFNTKYEEKIYAVNDNKIIGWTYDDHSLMDFTTISLFRLMKALEISNWEQNRLSEKFFNNILYAMSATEKSKYLTKVVILSILSSYKINPLTKDKILKLFKIDFSKEFKYFNKLIEEWRKNKQKNELLKCIAESDSSLF